MLSPDIFALLWWYCLCCLPSRCLSHVLVGGHNVISYYCNSHFVRGSLAEVLIQDTGWFDGMSLEERADVSSSP